MKKLPVGIQDFSELRGGGYVYVDKTQGIYRLATEGKYYFLSRPRRFGKSLLVSTMKELFSGNRALFEGLWIESRWDWQKTHPILHIPFAKLDYKDKDLSKELQAYLGEIAASYGIELSPDSLKNQFEELITRLAAKEGQVVLLIDDSAENALRQILERGYLDKDRSTGKKLIALGINFNTKKRGLRQAQANGLRQAQANGLRQTQAGGL